MTSKIRKFWIGYSKQEFKFLETKEGRVSVMLLHELRSLRFTMWKSFTNAALIIIALFVAKVFASNREFTCGLMNGNPTEYDAINFFVNHTSGANNVSVVFKELETTKRLDLLNQALLLLKQNVVALIEGRLTKMSACTLSEVTGIPLIRLHGDRRPFDQCEKVIQMSAGYKDYAHASLDILNKFKWKKIALVIDGKKSFVKGNGQNYCTQTGPTTLQKDR
ncbi:hypothetical protein ACROYT_G031154 [Oculina patagonica]